MIKKLNLLQKGLLFQFAALLNEEVLIHYKSIQNDEEEFLQQLLKKHVLKSISVCIANQC